MSGGKRRLAIAFAASLAAVMLIPAGPVAHAAFPGDNGRIAFSTGFLFPDNFELPSRTQVYTVAPDGSDQRRLTNVAEDHHAGAPDFSADGTRIVYQSDEAGEPRQFQLWVMNADGTGQTQITSDPDHTYWNPSWSPDGRRIAASRCKAVGFVGFCDIVTMKADGTDVHKLVGDRWLNFTPEYSPDGDEIAFASNRGGLLSAVWVVDADGGGLERLTPPALEAFWPDWSPDGRHLTVTSYCCLPLSQVYVMRADGSHLTQVTHFRGGHQAAFSSYSPDGSKLVLISNAARNAEGPYDDLYTMDVDGSDVERITSNRPLVSFSDWGVTP
jgi:Tol biopolymer transport system component